MSNPESFIDEVTEEVRRDKLFALMRRYGWIGIVAVLALVGGAGWVEWQKAQAARTAQDFGDAALAAMEADTPGARREALAAVAAKGEQAVVQRLLVASDPETGRDASLAALAEIEADATAAQVYRDLATLRRVILLGADLPPAEARALLDPLATPGRPFRPLAQEQLAYLTLAGGDRDGAITALRALTVDQEAPQGLRSRAAQMVTVLGGDPAAAAN